jgi:excisionase family DNA binding protein
LRLIVGDGRERSIILDRSRPIDSSRTEVIWRNGKDGLNIGNEALLRIADVANLLTMSVSTVYKYVERGVMDCYHVGTSLRFSRRHIENFLAFCERKNASKKNVVA